MAELFEPTKLKTLELSNRFVRSATFLGLANEDGSCSKRLIDAMIKLAEGGVGLIITGFSHVLKGGQSPRWQSACWHDRFLPGLTQMADAVHRVGGRIALQIAHCGLFSKPEMTGEPALGPSEILTENSSVGRSMTGEEIEITIKAFVDASVRAKKAGFDAVQIHAAHGYLISQFLSPFFNKRTDNFGGSLENRARLLMSVTNEIVERIGDDYPVLVKINAEDRLPDGFSTDEMLDVAAMLESTGIAALELSGGTVLGLAAGKPENSFSHTGKTEVYWNDAATAYKARLKTPLILVGGIRCYETAEALVRGGDTDYVSLSRPLIREPGLIHRWISGDRTKSSCISDNGCFKPGGEGLGVHCVHVHCSTT
jgi:2,4-dienoyl-CoA reductase-like NADH-dependent reductase (Old Yellow Enzyme family)